MYIVRITGWNTGIPFDRSTSVPEEFNYPDHKKEQSNERREAPLGKHDKTNQSANHLQNQTR